MERDKLVMELKYRESRLSYHRRDVKRCVRTVQKTFDFCRRRYERAMADKQVGDILPVPEERGYKMAEKNLVEAHRCDLPKARALYREEKKRIKIIKKLLQSMEATESNRLQRFVPEPLVPEKSSRPDGSQPSLIIE